MADLKTKIKVWYKENYGDDGGFTEEISDKATFEDCYNALKNKKDVLGEIGICDSDVRDRVFEGIAEVYDIEVDEIFDLYDEIVFSNAEEEE